MKLSLSPHQRHGSTIVVVLILCCITLLIMASALQWTSTSTNLSHRNNEYNRTVAIAEAATEKVIGRMAADYRKGGEPLLNANSNIYKGLVPAASNNVLFSKYEFNNGLGQTGEVFLQSIASTMFTNLDAPYRGLYGYATPFRVIANARQRTNTTLFNIAAGVRQDFQLTTIPIFQFAIFYNLDLEINPGPVMDITGPVHCNENIYIAPGDTLTFHDDVTSAEEIFEHRKEPPQNPPGGKIVYAPPPHVHVGGRPSLNLPIGTNNTPQNVREVVEVPPTSESVTSDMAKERFYNKADMIITVSNSGIKVTSGRFNNFATTNIPRSMYYNSNTLSSGFLKTASFLNAREGKTVLSLDIDIAKLVKWNATNATIRPVLTNTATKGDITIIYVANYLTNAGLPTQAGVRLVNGTELPPKGLTVATASPIYIKGHYNAPPAVQGKNDTTGTKPAAVVGDAVTILSANWNDSLSTLGLAARNKATHTTVNAAFLAGIVETTNSMYSGGVENFPRFLESWGNSVKFTYNGSMVVMFPSKHAKSDWVGTGAGIGIYDPPKREWAFDQNFRQLDKLPPGTPMMRLLVRSTWAMVRPNTTNVVAGP